MICAVPWPPSRGRELAAALRDAVAGRAGHAALIAAADAYRDYAREHPGRYLAMQRAPEAPGEDADAAAELYRVIHAALSAYGLHGEAEIHAIRAVRSALHGFASLEQAGGWAMPVSVDCKLRGADRIPAPWPDRARPPLAAARTRGTLCRDARSDPPSSARAALRIGIPAGLGYRILPAAADIIVALGLATVAVALLKADAPPAGLGVIYLLAVLEVAVRRGQRAALIASLIGVLTLNYLFVPPTGRLAIAHSSDLIELIVFLIAALVVGRLAAREQLRSVEAESRARLARNREREAELLAGAASALLTGG